ncbi:MAG: Uma2 family endonuclease [Cyanobacteria bacterium P01_F01_bin.150]
MAASPNITSPRAVAPDQKSPDAGSDSPASSPVVGEQRMVLYNVSWQLFETLLDELGETSNVRLAYDQGTLELMSPLMPHEHTKRLLERFVGVISEELDIDIRSAGSLTCKREDLLKGLEPDSGFYIQNELQVRHKEHIDLDIDPPPDLMIEVDFSNSSLNKDSIYLGLGVPELWRYTRGSLTIRWLVEGRYEQRDTSAAFPNLPLTIIPKFIEQSLAVGEAKTVKAFRKWVQEQIEN